MAQFIVASAVTLAYYGYCGYCWLTRPALTPASTPTSTPTSTPASTPASTLASTIQALQALTQALHVMEETAAAFSALSGVKIVCEKQAMIEIEKGNPRVKRLAIKDVFYKTKNTHWDGKGEEPIFYVPDSAYAPEWDCDFTDRSAQNDGTCSRGNYPYQRPYGWNRRAINVSGEYKSDCLWLGIEGWREESSPGEWPVSYHGTGIQNVKSILTEGYDTGKCVRNAFGDGIYSTPSAEVAELYAAPFKYKGENMKCILQNRVKLEESKIIPMEETGYGAPYFVTSNVDNIRPYGVCFKKMN